MKLRFTTAVLFFFSIIVVLPSIYQIPLEFNTAQEVTVSGRGFYPFSPEANTEFMELLNEGPNFSVTITDFEGPPIKIAPAKDFREIGRKKKIDEDGVYPLNFRKAKSMTNTAGLSFVGGMSPSTFILEIGSTSKGNCSMPVSCDTDCIEKSGMCCEANSDGNAIKWCNPTGVGSACGCINKRN